MMKALCALLVLALSAPALAEEPKGHLQKARRAEVLVVGEVVEVHASPGIWSGVTAALQYVRYRTVKVLLGNVQGEQFEVGHVLVQGSPSADPKKPRLLPTLFKPGNRLLLILDPDETRGPKSPWAEGVPTLFAMDERSGAVAATEGLLAQIEDDLQFAMFVGGPPYAARVKKTPIVLIAEVLELGPRPGLWMGSIIPSTQEVRYKVVEVLKGDVQAEKIEVGYFMIGDTRTTDTPDGNPGLTPSLFKPGNRLILLLTPGKCVENMTGPGPESGLPVFCSGDLHFGAVPADEEYLAKARNALKK
jgi:hypothetical protein